MNHQGYDMPIDFKRISARRTTKRIIGPIEIFQSLKVSDPAINDLWLAQGDALRLWDSNRRNGDVAIVLNTGAGKTLVGLLAAQSLVNETKGQVVYACSSIQLVEQTAAKAKGYGLGVTTYFQRTFSDELYQSGQAPCVTTYQALFNGRSRFFRDQVCAVVFDDAHAAEHLIRDQFTLRVSRADNARLFSQIVQVFHRYHSSVGVATGYKETYDRGDAYRSWFVPPFALRGELAELQRLLIEAKLDEKRETTFSWEYLRDRVDLCCLFISGQEIAFTPPVLPTVSLPYFDSKVRRLYLSATLTAKDAFVRTFGKEPDPIIAPETNAGECERLILIPRLSRSCKIEDVELARTIIVDKKALILTPSTRQAERWKDIVGEQLSDNVTEQVENFKAAVAPAKLLLKGRYDGVDVPGETCRVVVIDGLPSSVGPLERYLWEKLGLDKILRSTVASRIVQSFGRISRGMSDHGVVILTGESLINWLLTPINRAALPKFLRLQLDLGMAASKGASDCAAIVGAADQCLGRDTNWIAGYQDFMLDNLDGPASVTDEDALAVSRTEAMFGHSFWMREYADGARALSENLDRTFQVSRNAGAWHSLWLGYCYEMLGDKDQAGQLYRRSRTVSKNIPPVDLQVSSPEEVELPAQVIEVARFLYNGSKVDPASYRNFNSDLAALAGGGSTGQTEEAIRKLGEYLGLEASRPDNDVGTGPDVLWKSPGQPAFNQELKTGKRRGSKYRKEDVGQIYDHMQWVRDNTDTRRILSAFVGPVLAATDDSNPGPDITVIELEAYRALAERVHAALDDICSKALPITLAQTVYEVFRERDLLWPNLYDTLTKQVLREIR